MTDSREKAERHSIYDTPLSLENRAGLASLRYRIGTFSSFRRTMLRRIPRVQVTTDEGKPIAPLRSWSARDSADYGIALIELWAYVADILTFYQERIANEAFIGTAKQRESLVQLANLLDYSPAPGAAASVHLAFMLKDGTSAQIRKQFPVQHVPVGEEKPQTFETSEELLASAIWNELTPLRDQAHNLTFSIGQTSTRLKGARARIAVGDWVLIMGKKRGTAEPHSTDAGSERYEVRQIIEVKRLPETDETEIFFDLPLGTRRGGHDIVVESVADLYVFRERGALFGHNAPDWRAIGLFAANEFLAKPETIKMNDLDALAKVVRKQKDWINQEKDKGQYTLDLDRVYPTLVKDSWIVMINEGYREAYKVTQVETYSRSDYMLTAQVSRLQVDTDEHFDKYGLAKDAEFSKVRGTMVLLNSEPLPLAQETQPTFIFGTEINVREDVRSLEQGHLLMVYGETEQDGLQGEVVAVKEVQITSEGSKIVLAEGLAFRYVRANTRIFANVVLATHGKTVSDEILGNGDASISFQRFELKKSPLTYVPQAGAPNGVTPTLELRVNGVLWEQVRSFYGHQGDEAIYTITITDDEKTIIRTGDSHTGALLSTGKNNVSASYRWGMGVEGNVPAETIKTPLERPKGLQKVINPLQASGGAARENPESIRENAPNTVRTFGRIISLRDFEDAARESVGISKARAFIEWDQEWQAIKLVVAGDSGAPVVGQSLKNLLNNLNSRRDPNRKLSIETYNSRKIALSLLIYPDPAYIAEAVLDNVTAALEAFFAFDNLDLGQSIALSEVYSVIHSADGVLGAEITRFRFDSPLDRKNLQQVLRIKPNELLQLDSGSVATYEIGLGAEA